MKISDINTDIIYCGVNHVQGPIRIVQLGPSKGGLFWTLVDRHSTPPAFIPSHATAQRVGSRYGFDPVIGHLALRSIDSSAQGINNLKSVALPDWSTASLPSDYAKLMREFHARLPRTMELAIVNTASLRQTWDQAVVARERSRVEAGEALRRESHRKTVEVANLRRLEDLLCENRIDISMLNLQPRGEVATVSVRGLIDLVSRLLATGPATPQP